MSDPQKTFWKTFGVFLQHRREQGVVSAQEVADYLKISLRQLRLYEKGERQIPLSDTYALSNRLGIEPVEICLILDSYPNFPANLLETEERASKRKLRSSA